MEGGKEINPKLEEFRRRYEEELEELLDSGLYDSEPLPPDPSSMGLGEITLEDLGSEEMDIIRDVLYERFEINPSASDVLHREYKSQAPAEATVPGEIDIKVFKTNREGTYLHEMTFRDGAVRWAVGPDSNI